MRLIIAETGRPPEELRASYPDYPEMFRAMLAEVGFRPEVDAAAVMDGETVGVPEKGDALLVTGSAFGVYEEHGFIAPLEGAVRRFAEAGHPVVGICFGHQLVGQAFGAPVQKSAKGWGVGVHRYTLTEVGKALFGEEEVSCAVSHQDQIQELPPGFEIVGGSAFCPRGMLRHRELPVMTFQMHPEFSHDYASALLSLRRDRIPDDRAEPGLESLKKTSGRLRIARWIADFLKTAP